MFFDKHAKGVISAIASDRAKRAQASSTTSGKTRGAPSPGSAVEGQTMGVMRTFFLACSRNAWLRERATKLWFVRRAASRFMPGETAEAALAAAAELKTRSIRAVFTRLGENVTDRDEAESVTGAYIEILDSAREHGIDAEVSVKLTQLGLDLGRDLCFQNLERILGRAGPGAVVWIDMESSQYTGATLDLFRRARARFSNAGVCLQSYLYRTSEDLASLMALNPAIRLVKGAYNEPATQAFASKRRVDASYFSLAKVLLSNESRAAGVRAAIATHDLKLIDRIIEFAEANGIAKSKLEFQMLYGIKRRDQVRLAKAGYNVRVLISYGSYWFPWYMRRLAERPANFLFIIRNLV
ncbi:MAG: proline dehydrogenase family protein [Acidobacteriota bacterium]|nr:proline dehydrogenase family protein [Acidobacteriota bacterium]